MAHPVAPLLRQRIRDAARAEKIDVVTRGTYVCIEGPQFSSYAESLTYKNADYDVIGMLEIIHSRAAEPRIGDRERRGFDERCIKSETGAHSQHRPGILGNVRLEQGKREESGHVSAGSGTAGLLEAARPLRSTARDQPSPAIDNRFESCQKTPRAR